MPVIPLKTSYGADLKYKTCDILFFAKVGHSDLVLSEVTLSGKMHALMELQRSGACEKRDMMLTLKLNMRYLFFKRRSQYSSFVRPKWNLCGTYSDEVLRSWGL